MRGALTEQELAEQVSLLYLAGHETTVNLIGNAVLALLQHPDELHLLRVNPGLDTAAVDEFLRYDSPVQMSRRIRSPKSASVRRPSSRVPSSSSAWPLPIGTRASGVLARIGWICSERTPPSMSVLAAATTIASVRPWPVWKDRLPWGVSCAALTGSNWQASRFTTDVSTSAVWPASLWP